MAGEVGDLIVIYQKQEFHISGLRESDTVEDLKNAIYKETNVHPDRQKLLGLKYKGGNPGNDVTLQAVKVKPNTKLMLIGSTEEEIESVKPPEDIPDVLNDFDLDGPIAIAVQHKEEFLAKVERRVETYKVTEFNPPRPGKKLLVLDIDYTLFDHRSTAETAGELMRPYLHEFLTAAYVNYDIIIWSATGMKWIETKMKALGVSSHPAYKICFYLDSSAMISVHTEKYGVVEVKPLGVIWGKYKQWTPQNTIMFDDVRHNFLMNPRNGLRIRPFREAHKNRDKDTELLKLSKYLQDIMEEEDFTVLDHRKWEKYKKRKHTEKSEKPPEGASPT